MKITDYAPIGKSAAAGKKKNVSSAGLSGGDFFGLLSTGETDAATAPPPAADITSVTSMDGLLSLQEMPDDELQKRRAVQEGSSTLEALETLRMALLDNTVPEHLLHTLTRVVALQKQRIDDPRLMSIIEDIELRAAVELAKLERASHPK